MIEQRPVNATYHIEQFIYSAGIMAIFLPKPLGIVSIIAVVLAICRTEPIKNNLGLTKSSVSFVLGLALLSLIASDTASQLTENLEACLSIVCGMAIGLASYSLTIKARNYPDQWGPLALIGIILVAHLMQPQFHEAGINYYGFFGNPNTSARVLCVTLSMLLLVATNRSSSQPSDGERKRICGPFKLMLWLETATCIYFLVLTNYRSAWLGCAVVMASWTLSKPALSIRKKMALCFAAGLGSFLLFKFVDVKGFSASNNSIYSRLDLWHALLTGWLNQRPLRGFGVGSFQNLDHLYMGRHAPTIYPHNAVVEILCLSGIIGLILAACLAIAICKNEFNAIKAHGISPVRRLSLSLLAGAATLLMLDMSFFGTKSFAMIYACLGCISGSPQVSRNWPTKLPCAKQ